MKSTSKSITSSFAQLGCDKTRPALRKSIWMSLLGNAYAPIAYSPNEAKKMAKQLREMADWVETTGVKYLSNEKGKR